MKKLINQVDRLVDEALEGLEAAFRPYLRRLPDTHVLVRARPKAAGRVALVSGGGSGHEPAHAGYVGYGMLDAAVAGEVFTSPTPDQILAAIRAVDTGAGVLLVVKNYTGDVMNFDLAQEMAAAEGHQVASVLVNDDVAVENSLYTAGRRGIAGTVLVHKIAGAKAESGAPLEEVRRVAADTVAETRSMGLALSPCTVPARGQPTFTLDEDEIEMGIGIHGEPGVRREPLRPADALAGELLERIATDLGLQTGERVWALVNGLGATPLIELAVWARYLDRWSRARGLGLAGMWLGEYMTSLDMGGASLTLSRLDAEREALLTAPCDTPALRQGVNHE
ncbi:dihydroxyacetone kinase, N-terminal domain [Candidatus Hydrogenisulfobacillus filiaventi]|uniref:Dihydroxyacetone kinase, N-terminal domain n=1 Tax=Candidatus Hydrogenisulfobacillus filiaventi TaxID=2707344 RepID=A0A6F8ZL33_9FIRM|nr:dihydroxyacetone kinase, N-terminal domain [Candidatus Hydrogenisulfobacillus filiaventi]